MSRLNSTWNWNCTILLLFLSLFGCYCNGAQRLNMTLYYESQCPDCDGFIANDLYPTWKKIYGAQYFDIEFVPYGNARTEKTPEGSIEITCQHGPDECKGNILHNCALNYIPTEDLRISFIACTFFSKNPYKAGAPCSKLLKIDFSPIRNCTESDEGARLHYLAGQKTNALSPSHEYVPWIIFNGVYNKQEMESAQVNFFSFLCKKLKSMQVKVPPQCADADLWVTGFGRPDSSSLNIRNNDTGTGSNENSV